MLLSREDPMDGQSDYMNSDKTLPEDFMKTLRSLEESYLAETDPIRQSGFGGGAERWRRERGLILEAIDADGDFLDIGCANGYLLECLVRWGKDRGINLSPFGLDIGSRLIELARQRFPDCCDHFWVGNAWDWVPPRRFRYVYSLADVVPPEYLRRYIQRLLELFVDRDGKLILGAYGSTSKRQPAQDVHGLLETFGFVVAGGATCGDLPVSHVAWMIPDRVWEDKP
jgi:SAM-dependent methyltransferase